MMIVQKSYCVPIKRKFSLSRLLSVVLIILQKSCCLHAAFSFQIYLYCSDELSKIEQCTKITATRNALTLSSHRSSNRIDGCFGGQ